MGGKKKRQLDRRYGFVLIGGLTVATVGLLFKMSRSAGTLPDGRAQESPAHAASPSSPPPSQPSERKEQPLRGPSPASGTPAPPVKVELPAESEKLAKWTFGTRAAVSVQPEDMRYERLLPFDRPMITAPPEEQPEHPAVTLPPEEDRAQRLQLIKATESNIKQLEVYLQAETLEPARREKLEANLREQKESVAALRQRLEARE